MGVKNVIVTLGKRRVIKTPQVCHYFLQQKINIVWIVLVPVTIFISALASIFRKVIRLKRYIQIAIQAAGFSVSKEGVIDSLVHHVTLKNYF